MITIRLYCVSGMLSTLLINKIKDAAKLKEIDINISTISEHNLDKELKGVDIVLLGPQVAYKLPKFSAACNKFKIACDVMNMKDYGMMNGEKILETAIRLIDENKKRVEEEERIKQEELERIEAEKIEKQKELERIEAERIQKEEEERIEKEKELERQEAERLKREQELEQERIAKESMENETILMAAATVEEPVDDDRFYENGRENNIKGYDEMIEEAKKMLLSAEEEVYISTNIEISELQEELLEVSQRGVKITVVSFNKYAGEELPIDKLYTYIDEKDKTVNTKIMMTVDGRRAFVAEKDSNNNEIVNTDTDDKLLTSVVTRNINNYIYLLKLRDNINFKLRDN